MKTRKNIKTSLFMLAALLLINACSKPERDNPWDEKSNLKPEDWAPQNLVITNISLGERKLTWQYTDKNIHGFRIDRKSDGGQWQEAIAIPSKEARSWYDTTILPGAGVNNLYEYRLMAVAGNNLSSAILATTAAQFAPPSNFSALKLDEKTFKLTWEDNSAGEHGFKIDRKVGDNLWQENFATVLPNTITWTDTNVFEYKAGIEVQYRVYGYFKTVLSEKISTTGTTDLPAPTNLTATIASASKIDIAWNYSIPWIDGFVVDRKMGNDNWVERYKQVTGGVHSCTDENFTLNTTIYYRVKAFINFFSNEFVSGYAEYNIGVPTVTTTTVSAITQTTATSGGNVTLDGNSAVLARGVCWSTLHNPTISNNHSSDGATTGEFTSSITGLVINTLYYVRAYSTNAFGTSYGNEVSFTTQPIAIPTLTTTAVTNITLTTAIGGGNITSSGGGLITARGVCWSTSQNPTLSNSHTTNGNTGTGSYTDSITGLLPGTKYYVRAYGTNSAGTGYGNQLSFTTLSASVATVSTTEATNITQTTATSGGNVTSDGGATVTARGVCWSVSQNPTTNSPHTTNGSGTGIFSSSLTNLTTNKTYYVRAYATNSKGTAYGNQITFTTDGLPTVSTSAPTNVTQTTATSGGNVTSDGGATVSARGVCWSTSSNPTLTAPHTTNGSGTGIFTSSLTGLTQNTTYYVRAYATNSFGTAYGNEITFTTLVAVVLPTVSTTAATNIGQTTATSGGNVTSDGGATVSARGVCWSTSSNPTFTDPHTTDGSGTGSFTSSLTGLTPNTTYYVRAYATNSIGTAYGNQITFTTLATVVLPTVTTAAATNIAQTSATSGGNVTDDGGATVTVRGVCWNTSSNPIFTDPHTMDGTGTGIFTSSLTGLTANTVYHVRAYATNSVGTAYGNEVIFTTLAPVFTCGTSSLTINHVAGAVAPVIKTVTYGTVTNIPGETAKCWITSNLGADHQATSVDDATEASAGWYWQFDRKQGFKHDGTTRTPPGVWLTSIIENSDWTTNNDPCTLELGSGWRIPTQTEWTNVDASGSWTNWNGPWSSGLKLHAAGYVGGSGGALNNRGSNGYYWSSIQNNSTTGWGLQFHITLSNTYEGYTKAYAFSLRCLKE